MKSSNYLTCQIKQSNEIAKIAPLRLWKHVLESYFANYYFSAIQEIHCC